MNISLTWVNYSLIVSACLAVYYLVVLFLYRKSFGRFLPAKATDKAPLFSHLSSAEMPSGNEKHVNLFGEEVSDEDMVIDNDEQAFAHGAQSFADEIHACTASCGEEILKEELIQHLQRIIQKYPSLISNDSKYELSQLIAMATENNCSIHLSADELSELWNG